MYAWSKQALENNFRMLIKKLLDIKKSAFVTKADWFNAKELYLAAGTSTLAASTLAGSATTTGLPLRKFMA